MSPAKQHLYVLGHPIGHSKSPVMYNAAYPLLGLPWEYGFADIPAEEDARAFLAARDFLSVNITTPYKPLAFAEADVRDPSAVLAHGANVLVKQQDGMLAAHNTDGEGCVLAIKRGGFSFAGAKVAVCGTGPTSLAIMRACALAGAAEVRLLGRNAERAQAAVARYQEECAALRVSEKVELCESVPYVIPGEANAASEAEESRAASAESRAVSGSFAGEARLAGGAYDRELAYLGCCDLIVNATPLGMNADDPAPFSTSVLHAGQTVFDCVYGHGVTELVRAAREVGCNAHDGAAMLVAQAVATVHVVCDAAGVPIAATDETLFQTMAKAAEFNC